MARKSGNAGAAKVRLTAIKVAERRGLAGEQARSAIAAAIKSIPAKALKNFRGAQILIVA